MLSRVGICSAATLRIDALNLSRLPRTIEATSLREDSTIIVQREFFGLSRIQQKG